MQKIVFFNSTMQMGGPARVINLWSNYFVDNGYEVEVVSNIDVPLFYHFDGSIKYSILGIDKFQQKCKVKTLYKMFIFLKNRKNEALVFSKGLYIGYLFVLKKIGLIDDSLRLVYVIHGGTSDFKIIYNNLTKYMILKVFDNIVVNYDDYHKYKKTVSKSFKRKIIDSLMGDCFDELKPKVTCLLNPATFRSNKTPTYDNKVVIAVGRLDYIKGFDLLIDSWSAIAPDYPGWKLRIVGGGERAQDLINQIDQLSLNNVVEMIPSSDDVKSLLLSSSIYAMSSREEGLPMAVIEAMECGLPVVAFNNIGASYLVKDKENGLVCDIGNTEALSSNMEALMNDKEMRQEMGCKSKEMAQQFHIENIFPIWNDLLS